MKILPQTIATSKIIFFICSALVTNILLSMKEEKFHTITIHNQQPLTSQARITVIEVQKNAKGESSGCTITDIAPGKSMPFTKKITTKAVDFILKIEEKNQYNQMAINIKSETAHEDIYVHTKNEKIIVSNTTQKLATLYAINKKQEI